jgi:hypothetical protein
MAIFNSYVKVITRGPTANESVRVQIHVTSPTNGDSEMRGCASYILYYFSLINDYLSSVQNHSVIP